MIGRFAAGATDETPKLKGFDDFEFRLGDIMRGERATLGKSLLDVQRDLRIRATYIAAIENSDPSAFETPGFVAGYVRSYARYLGMEPDRVYADFCKECGFRSPDGMSMSASSAATGKSVAPSRHRDPLAEPNLKFLPTPEPAFARVEPAAIGSILVLVVLIGAMGFGGWKFLQEIQRVDVTAPEQEPLVVGSLDPLAGGSGSGTADRQRSEALVRLYRSEALDVPILEPRDGPIAAVDPRFFGVFATPAPVVAPQEGSAATGSDDQSGATVQVVEDVALVVSIVAVRPAWVRVNGGDGSVLLEKILNAGETYVLPATEDPPVLRVGESGAVYFLVGGQHYGPAGPAGVVTRNVVLGADALRDRYAAADPEQDQDLSRMYAQTSANATVTVPEAE